MKYNSRDTWDDIFTGIIIVVFTALIVGTIMLLNNN